jgi:BioD-like phosphotransacetylase family protein
MTTLIISSRQALVGKTAVAVGLARSLADAGLRPRLARITTSDTDGAAQSDASCFASLSLAPKGKEQPLSLKEAAKIAKASRSQKASLVLEMPAGISPAEATRSLKATVLLVESFCTLDIGAVTSIQREIGDAFAGLVVTAVPRPHMGSVADKLATEAVPSLALLPEDKLLASPSIAEVSQALEAELLFANAHAEDAVEQLAIASIAVDPGQAYFARLGHQAVVVRLDKPDLQIAALNAGVQCLILTRPQVGDLHGMPLPYVTQRAEEESIPLLVTSKDTVPAVQALEDLYASSRFQGPRKAERIGELMAEHLDADALLKALGVKRGKSKRK